MLFHIGNLEKVEKAISETEGQGICVSFRFIKMNTPIACKAAVQISAGKKRTAHFPYEFGGKNEERICPPLRPEAGKFHALLLEPHVCLRQAFLVTGKNTCGQLPGYL